MLETVSDSTAVWAREKVIINCQSHSQLVSEGVACSRKLFLLSPEVGSKRGSAPRGRGADLRHRRYPFISHPKSVWAACVGRDKALCFEFRHPCEGVRRATLAGRAGTALAFWSLVKIKSERWSTGDIVRMLTFIYRTWAFCFCGICRS